MPAGLLIRLRPTGPWRIGPDSGDRDRVDRIYHSDSLYSAVSGVLAQLGMLEEGTGEVGRFFPAFGQYGGTLMENVRGFHSDQHSAGGADEPRNSPGGENVSQATCASSAFHLSLRPKHDGSDPATGGNPLRQIRF